MLHHKLTHDIITDMKSISLTVSLSDYKAFKEASKVTGISIARMIREAMSLYRKERLEAKTFLNDLPVLSGHRPLFENLPTRANLYDEIYPPK